MLVPTPSTVKHEGVPLCLSGLSPAHLHAAGVTIIRSQFFLKSSTISVMWGKNCFTRVFYFNMLVASVIGGCSRSYSICYHYLALFPPKFQHIVFLNTLNAVPCSTSVCFTHSVKELYVFTVFVSLG